MKPAIFMLILPLLLGACQSQRSVIGDQKIGEARAQLPRESSAKITAFVLERLGNGIIWDGPFTPSEARMKAAMRDNESWHVFTAADSSRCYYIVYEQVLVQIDFVGSSRHGRAFAPRGVIRFSDNTPMVIYQEEPNQSPIAPSGRGVP